ncbi:MAG: protein kinase [Burkholderiales bacterium]|nr:protein kinase [Burkholderiales bacterium]
MDAAKPLTNLRFGRYRAIREIGRGATSSVYLAEDDGGVDSTDAFGGSQWTDDNSVRPKKVAVKVVDFTDDKSKLSRRFRKLFATEAAVTAQFDHPNIARVFDWKVEEKQAYLVMELVEGRGLDQFVTMDKLLPMHRVVGIIFKVAMALDYAHRRGIVHRDIKPANVMLTKDDEVKLMDFGLALNIKKNVNIDSTFINGLGSPSYMSPEQIKGYTLNHQTDLYSLGVMFYQMLAGRLPFRAPNTAALVYKIINTEAVPVTQLNPDLPELTNKVIARALEKDLYSRYRLGSDMAKDLSAVRFQILEENVVLPDEAKWKNVRSLPLLGKLDDVDIWEILRLSAWRILPPATVIMKDGEPGRSFGFILEGEVEVEKGDRAMGKLTRGDMIGEVGFLESESSKRTASITTLTQVTYLEINPAAFAFATEELVEEIRRIAIDTMIGRMRAVNRLARRVAPAAIHPAALPEGENDIVLAGAAPAMVAGGDAPGWSVFNRKAQIAAIAAAVPAAAAVTAAMATPATPAATSTPRQTIPAPPPAAAAEVEPPVPLIDIPPLAPAAAPERPRAQTVVVQPLPASAAAVIAQLAMTQHPPARGAPLQPFELGPESTVELGAPIPVAELPADAVLTTDLGAQFDAPSAFATTEIAPGFDHHTTGAQTTEMAPRFDATGQLATTEMAPTFAAPAPEPLEAAPDFRLNLTLPPTSRPVPPAHLATTEIAAHFMSPPPARAQPAPEYLATTEMAAHFLTGAPPSAPSARGAPPAGAGSPSLMPPTRRVSDQSTQDMASHMLQMPAAPELNVDLGGGMGSAGDGLEGLGQDMFPPILPDLAAQEQRASPVPAEFQDGGEDFESTQVLGAGMAFPSLPSADEPIGAEITEALDAVRAAEPFSLPPGPLSAGTPAGGRPGRDRLPTPDEFDRTVELSGGFLSQVPEPEPAPEDELFPPLRY